AASSMEGCSRRIIHASNTLSTGTPRLDTLATVVDSRCSTIDHNHQAAAEASSALYARPPMKAGLHVIGRCGTSSATSASATPPASICHAVRLSTPGAWRRNMRLLNTVPAAHARPPVIASTVLVV